jgi:CRP-like cAMP-binding protein
MRRGFKTSLSIKTGGFLGSPPSSSTHSIKNLSTRSNRNSNRSTHSRRSKSPPAVRPISHYGWSSDDVTLLTNTVNKLIHQKLAAGWFYLVRGIQHQKQEVARERDRRTTESFLQSVKKKSSERNNADFVHIRKWAKEIHKGVFNDMSEEEVQTFSSGVEIEMMEKEDQLLFLQGSVGQHFYIIIQGFVQLYICSNLHQVSVKLELQKELRKEFYGNDNQLIQNYKANSIGLTAEENTYFGKHILTLKKGKSFGEVALFSSDSIRAATAVAMADKSNDKFKQGLKSRPNSAPATPSRPRVKERRATPKTTNRHCNKKALSTHILPSSEPQPTILLKVNKAVYNKCFERHHRVAWERANIIRLLKKIMFFDECTRVQVSFQTGGQVYI